MTNPYFDGGYHDELAIFEDHDCNNLAHLDEANYCQGWWMKKGVSDGMHNVPDRTALVPVRYQKSYKSGYNDGLWFRLETTQRD